MTFRWSQRLVLALGILTALMGVGSVGCMGERAPINRVQPDYLDKEQLIPVQYGALTSSGATPATLTLQMIRQEPQWIHQVTIIDKPATTGFMGISWYTQVERINWEVTENFLVARQAYDRLHNAQGNGPPSVAQNPRQGEILAVYRIQSHFDIRRSYNPGTGEEQNIIEENGSDRPWYQRRYMRVDWSQNLVGGYSAMSYAEWTGRVRAEPVAQYINNPTDPNRPVFNYGTFNGQENVLTYFDVTNRTVLHPEELNFGEWGYPNLPACLFAAPDTVSCQAADVLMRVSFMRLDPNRDYEPQALDGHRMDRFGFFEAARAGFNRQESNLINTERRHMSARHNLWMQHHASPASGLDHFDAIRAWNASNGDRQVQLPAEEPSCQADADCVQYGNSMRCDTATHTCGDRFIRCTEDAQCAGVGFNARCDTDIAYTRSDRDPVNGLGYGLCLLPYRARTVRPVAYHLSPNYPERLMTVTNDVVADWNRAFAGAVQSARHRECLLDPAVADKSECEQWRDPNHERTADSRFVYVGCHNPVWGTAEGPGQHTADEVAQAHASGWDLPGACGPQGTSARLGDVRYSMIAAIEDFDMQGAWGLAGISGDPETGEVYSGRGAVWQWITDLQAAWATDLIRVLNGDLSPEQIANGENVVAAYGNITNRLDNREARTGDARRDAPPAPRPVHRDIQSREELESILQATNFSHFQLRGADAANGGPNPGLRPHEPTGHDPVNFNTLACDRGHCSEHNFLRNAAQRFARHNPLVRPGVTAEARNERLRGTEIEAMLLNQQQIDGAGFNANLGVTPEVVEAASPFRRWNPGFRQLQNRLRSMLSAHQCNYEAEFSDDVIETLVYRFRNNEVPPTATFGRTWQFTTGGTNEAGNPALNYAVVREYLTNFIHRGVLAHEIGHSVGQRHNFAGSADAVNYFDQYWELRGQGHRSGIVPRFQHMAEGEPFYSDEERRGGVEEYGYASVMDYKGFNEDAHGLGRYDFAFVKHGYVNMVEAFDQVADEARALNLFQTMSGGGQQNMSFGLTAEGRLTSFHYTELPRVVGQVERNGRMVPNVGSNNRFDVFLHETSSEGYNTFNWMPDHTNVANANRDGTAGRHLVVPYRFATDDQAGWLWYDQRYDAGADMFESIRYTAQRYLDYYFANSFARERSTFTAEGYVGRMMGRYLDNLYYVMRLAAIYEVFYADIFGGVSNRAEWERQPATMSNRLGIATSIDTFTNAILMPESSAQYGGQHTLRSRPDGTQVYEQSVFGDRPELDIQIGDGRQYETRYDWASGYFWRDRIINAGSYYDKVIGLMYLTSTFLYAPDRTFTITDIRNYQVNVYTVYPAQTIRFFGSLLSQDHTDIGPQVRNPGRNYQLLRTRLSTLTLPEGTGAGQNGRDPALRSIDPNVGFTGELWGAVMAMSNLAGTFDQRFIQNARLWAEGDDQAIPAGSAPMVTFTDPTTNITYHALHFGAAPGEPNADVGLSRRDRARNEAGVAARMILHAQDLRNAMEREAAGSPGRARLARQLQQYVDLLNVMRNLNRYFSTGYY